LQHLFFAVDASRDLAAIPQAIGLTDPHPPAWLLTSHHL
jgi:hypothetical protein